MSIDKCWVDKPDFIIPRAYSYLLEQGLVSFEQSSVLQPWYYIKPLLDIRVAWPDGPCKERLVAFARRQDCDDIACFIVDAENVKGICVIHGWTSSGYDVCRTLDTVWDWLKLAIDDIAELVDLEADRE